MVINTMINGDWWCLVLCCLYCSIVFDQLPGWTSMISICFDVSKGWQGLDPYPYAAPFLNVPRLSTIPGRICDKKCRPRYCATVLGLSSFCCDTEYVFFIPLYTGKSYKHEFSLHFHHAEHVFVLFESAWSSTSSQGPSSCSISIILWQLKFWVPPDTLW